MSGEPRPNCGLTPGIERRVPDPRSSQMPTRLGQTFGPRGNSYPVAENIAILDNDIADVDADPKFDAAGVRHTSITVGHMVLRLVARCKPSTTLANSTNRPSPGRFHYSPMMFDDLGIEDFGPDRLRLAECPFFVRTNQSR
jgi:hypothetical protein